MKLEDLFNIKNGISSNNIDLIPTVVPNAIPYVRPSSTQQRTIAGWVIKDKSNLSFCFPKNSLFVSTNGEGSHTYAYVSSFEFIPNSDVSVLIPKKEMTTSEKIFYAKCISMNRYKFSYGRKPKGKRLGLIDLPDHVPDWVTNGSHDIDFFKNISSPLNYNNYDFGKGKNSCDNWEYFILESLFEIKKGKRLTKNEMTIGTTNYIGSSDANNGITDYIGQKAMSQGGVITVAYDGSVGEAFYQEEPFWASDAVNILQPKFEINKYIALFICTVIRMERYRFSYGRKWTLSKMKNSTIKLPALDSGAPDWQFMENYIKSLPYSSSI